MLAGPGEGSMCDVNPCMLLLMARQLESDTITFNTCAFCSLTPVSNIVYTLSTFNQPREEF